MRNRFQRLNSILHFIGDLLAILGLILLVPVIAVYLYWGQNGEGWRTLTAFLIASLVSFSVALLLKAIFKSEALDTTGAMLMCAVGWIAASAVGAVSLPKVKVVRPSALPYLYRAEAGFENQPSLSHRLRVVSGKLCKNGFYSLKITILNSHIYLLKTG